MSERKSWVVGVWCGEGSKLLAPISGGTNLLMLTLLRVPNAYPLLPWTPDLDHMEQEIRYYRWAVRCHPEKLVAMRDLVVEKDAAYGALVDASCGVIDKHEVLLGVRRCENGWDEYVSKRVTVYPAERWLKVSHTDEWMEPMGVEGLRKFFYAHGRQDKPTGYLRARDSAAGGS